MYVVNRQIAIDLFDCLPDLWHDRGCRSRDTHHEITNSIWSLCMRDERHRRELLLQVSEFGVLNYSDNFDCFGGFRTINSETFTNGRSGGEKLSHHRFINECDFLRVLGVLRSVDSSL